MFATWPMVFGALVAGLIAGFLIPEVKQKPAPSSVVAAKTVETTKTAAPKRSLPTPAADGTSAPATKDTPTGTPQKSAENEDCERQTWPYLTPNCLDRSAQAAKADVVVKTKIAEPKPEVNSEPKPTQPQAPAATASTAPKADSPPKANAAPATSAATNPAPAPKADTGAAAKNAAASPAPTEARPAEKQEPAQAAAPAPEKSARRPAARTRPDARAEALDEPLRPRGERYRDRGERRYAGQYYDDDRPVYIERGGRLYLAPEYQHRLRGPERYWREW